MTKTDSRRYYPTALALYITYFVLGIAATIMGQYKQDFAALWGASKLADGSFDVSSVVAVIAAIGLGRLVAFPIAGPLSDRLGRRLSALIGCVLYAIFLLAISIAQFLLPFAIGFVAARNLPFHTIFIATAVIIIVDGIFLCFLPFPPFERVVKSADKPKEKMHFTAPAIILICLGFTTSTTFMLWMNCNQELGKLYGLQDPAMIQSFYSVGIVCALFVSAALLSRKVEPAKILIVYPCIAFITLGVIYFVQTPFICLAGGFLLGFFAAGGVLQLVTAVANEMFPKNRGVITSIVMIASSVANYLVISVAGVLTRVGGTNGPRLVLLFNMAVTLVGILLALYLNVCQKRERAAAEKAEA